MTDKMWRDKVYLFEPYLYGVIMCHDKSGSRRTVEVSRRV